MKKWAVAVAAQLCFGQMAMAAYTIHMVEANGNVVATGSGSISKEGLAQGGNASTFRFLDSSTSDIHIGGSSAVASSLNYYKGPTGSIGFGSIPGAVLADAASGSSIGIGEGHGDDPWHLYLPEGYESGSPLGESTATWNGFTFSDLGLIEGTYTWQWGSGPTTDTLTLHIGPLPPEPIPPTEIAAVPTLEAWGLGLLAAMAGALGLRARRKV